MEKIFFRRPTLVFAGRLSPLGELAIAKQTNLYLSDRYTSIAKTSLATLGNAKAFSFTNLDGLNGEYNYESYKSV